MGTARAIAARRENPRDEHDDHRKGEDRASMNSTVHIRLLASGPQSSCRAGMAGCDDARDHVMQNTSTERECVYFGRVICVTTAGDVSA